LHGGKASVASIHGRHNCACFLDESLSQSVFVSRDVLPPDSKGVSAGVFEVLEHWPEPLAEPPYGDQVEVPGGIAGEAFSPVPPLSN
jgi:hypothetical protein